MVQLLVSKTMGNAMARAVHHFSNAPSSFKRKTQQMMEKEEKNTLDRTKQKREIAEYIISNGY
ncbi:hypothetical protein D7Z54_09655 [Salibacterium salarium]|uniref:Uncharacterized protein n=1 Tax=Salibacterium salarium TaxID=284579 RepID=A0A3R9P9S8_9BACI|nr:hypothetical protein D7Z54_09655 [Salibacterium salarium]